MHPLPVDHLLLLPPLRRSTALPLAAFPAHCLQQVKIRCCNWEGTTTRGRRIAGHGEDSLLRQQGAQERAVDARRGQAPRRLRPGQRLRQLAPAPQARRAEPVRQELPAAVDELPAAGHQARAFHPGGAQVHPPAPRHRRQQVVHDRRAAAWADGQRDQELLEHQRQEAAPPGPGGRRRRAGRTGEPLRRRNQLPRGAPHGAVGDRAPRGRGAPLPTLRHHLGRDRQRRCLLVLVVHRRGRRRRPRGGGAAGHLPAPLELRGRGLVPQVRALGGARGPRASKRIRRSGAGLGVVRATRRRLLGGVQRDRGRGGGRVPGIPGPGGRGLRAVPRPPRRVPAVPGGGHARRDIPLHRVRLKLMTSFSC